MADHDKQMHILTAAPKYLLYLKSLICCHCIMQPIAIFSSKYKQRAPLFPLSSLQISLSV